MGPTTARYLEPQKKRFGPTRDYESLSLLAPLEQAHRAYVSSYRCFYQLGVHCLGILIMRDLAFWCRYSANDVGKLPSGTRGLTWMGPANEASPFLVKGTAV